ncbi:MAG: hypothetical protein ACYTF3_00155 [Planctomycetota bacterium]|jgi:hypothetical protein
MNQPQLLRLSTAALCLLWSAGPAAAQAPCDSLQDVNCDIPCDPLLDPNCVPPCDPLEDPNC